METQPVAGHDERRRKQVGDGTTFLAEGCVFLASYEHGGSGGDGSDPRGDGGGLVRGNPRNPSPNSCGGGEEGNRAPCLARWRSAWFFLLVRARGVGRRCGQVGGRTSAGESWSPGSGDPLLRQGQNRGGAAGHPAVVGAGDDPVVA